MNGSEKQVKWAEEIKASKASEVIDLKSRAKNPVAVKAVEYLENNEEAAFWIDNRTSTFDEMFRQLISGGIYTKGSQYDNKAKLDPKTGIITETWTDKARQPKSRTL